MTLEDLYHEIDCLYEDGWAIEDIASELDVDVTEVEIYINSVY